MLRDARLLLAGVILVPALVFWLARGDADLDRRVPARAGETLSVALELTGPFAWNRGTLEIAGHDDDEVRVEVSGSGWGQYALDLDVDDTPGGVRVAGKLDGFLHWAFGGPEFDVRIRVPSRMAIDVRADNAPVVFEDVNGAIDARVDSGTVTVERAVGGDVRIRSTGDIKIEDVEGNLALESERGGIHVESVTGGVQARSDRGRIHLESVNGPIDTTNSRGTTMIERVRGDVRARSERGRIQIEHVRGRVDVQTARARIEINEQDGEVRARSGRGRIGVEFAGRPRGLIVADRGEIDVEVPDRAGFDLVASTAKGRVELDRDFAFTSTEALRPTEALRLAPGAIGRSDSERSPYPISPAVGANAGSGDRGQHVRHFTVGSEGDPHGPHFTERHGPDEWGESGEWEAFGDWGDWGDWGEGGDWKDWGGWGQRGDPGHFGARGHSPDRPEINRGHKRRADRQVGRVNGGGGLLRLHSGRGAIRVQD